jgi:cell division topological specificity factor
MIEFLKKLFGSAPPSSSTAKERLRLVLMTDHLALAPEIIDQMKRDLVDVISRYVEVDRDKIEVNFEQQDKALAMLANIPIISVNRPNGGVPEKVAPKPEPELVAAAAATPAGAGDAPPTRRRRRRKRAPNAVTGTAPAGKPATAI